MAASSSDKAAALLGSLHYYTVALSNIPFALPLQAVAEAIVPNPEDTTLRFLLSHKGMQAVPHQLQVYKEALTHKFGYVSYAVIPAPPMENTETSETKVGEEQGTDDPHPNAMKTGRCVTAEDHEVVHRTFLQWVAQGLALQLQTISCQCHLAQPRACYSSLPWYQALEQSALMQRQRQGGVDSRKVMAFLLSKAQFFMPLTEGVLSEANGVGHGNNALWMRMVLGPHDDPPTTTPESAEESAACFPFEWTTPSARLSLDTLQPREVLWLKKMLLDAPPVWMTNNDPTTMRVEPELWKKFLGHGLSSFIEIDA